MDFPKSSYPLNSNEINHYFNFFQISYSTIHFEVVKYVYHTKEGDFK
nr:MAG TPA: hypothetical protein [Caudoviricetes sp.]